MGRLTALTPRLGPLKARLTSRADAHGHDDSGEAWRAWYKTRRWKALRWSVLVRDGFTCQCGCGYEGGSPELVADHKQPHRGDPALFWDDENLETLRANPCHNSRKQAAEKASPWRGRGGGGGSKS